MGGALDRTTGKRQARALTSFIEAVNLSEKLGSQASEKDLRRDLDGGEHHSHGLLVHVPAQVRQASPKSARPWRGSQADQAASSRVHSASLVQPARIRYPASSADISMVPSGRKELDHLGAILDRTKPQKYQLGSTTIALAVPSND